MVWLTRSCSCYLTVLCQPMYLLSASSNVVFLVFSKTVLRKASLFSQDIKEQKFYSCFSHNPKYSDIRDVEEKGAGIKKDHPLDVGVTWTRIMLEIVSPLEKKFT